MDLLSSCSASLEKGLKDKVHCKVNIAESSYYTDSYGPEDSYYNEATDLLAYMGELGNVDALQHILQCSQAMREGKPKPKPNFKRERRPIWPELQIKGQLWSSIWPELQTAWVREIPENKEKVITQFKVPVVNNRQLTAYKVEIRYDNGGYESDFTNNTHNSENTYIF